MTDIEVTKRTRSDGWTCRVLVTDDDGVHDRASTSRCRGEDRCGGWRRARRPDRPGRALVRVPARARAEGVDPARSSCRRSAATSPSTSGRSHMAPARATPARPKRHTANRGVDGARGVAPEGNRMTESVASLGVYRSPRSRGRPPEHRPADRRADPHLGVLARPDVDRCRRERDGPGPPRVRRPVAPGTEGMSLAVHRGRGVRVLGGRPADGRLDQRLHHVRWGRRKPYIVFGALLDVVFLVGIATANSLVAIAAFVTLLALQHEHRARRRSRATSRTSFPTARSG